MQDQQPKSDLRIEIEKRVHIAMIHARNTKDTPSIAPMLKDTVNILTEEAHRYAATMAREELEKLKEEMKMHTVPEGRDLITRSYLNNSIDFAIAALASPDGGTKGKTE